MSIFTRDKHVQILRRRQKHLKQRIQLGNYAGISFDEAEVTAIDFALGCILITLKAGLLDRDAFNPPPDE